MLADVRVLGWVGASYAARALASERTEPATQRRLAAALSAGIRPISHDAMSFVALVSAWFLISRQLPAFWHHWRTLMTHAMEAVARPQLSLDTLLTQAADLWLMAVVPLLAIVALTLLAWAAQGAVALRSRGGLSHVSPKDPTSLRSAWLGVKCLVVLMGVASIANTSLPAVLSSATGDLGYALRLVGRVADLGASRLGIVLALLVIADLIVVRLLWRHGLRMTRAELRRELRDTYGDPALRGERRRRQQTTALEP